MPRFQKNDPITHEPFNAMAEAIEGNYVASNGTVNSMRTSAGTVLQAANISQAPEWAIVTTQIAAYNSLTGTAGFGWAVRRRKDESGVFQSYGEPVKVWNDLGVVAVGKRIKIIMMEDQTWGVFTANC